MKKLIFIALAVCFITAGCGYLDWNRSYGAENETNPITITAKQGFVMTWDDQTVKNLTTFETIKTKKVDKWNKWNALWEGWSLDAGFAYDASIINGALLIGRNFGTLGDYLPLDFPLKDKITITIYPFGFYIENLGNHPKFRPASGGAIIKAEIKFG